MIEGKALSLMLSAEVMQTLGKCKNLFRVLDISLSRVWQM